MNITSAHAAAITAFSLWGLLPLYWKILLDIGPWDIFGHRLIWSVVTLALILTYKGQLHSIVTIWRNKRVRYMLMLSSLLISSNWFLYVYAVNVGKVLEASMGYFLNPLLNVFMGWLILKEQIRVTQWPAIILAIISIVLMALQTDMARFPWIAIALSVTFALYGLIRKTTQVGSLEGLAFETFFILGPVLIFWSTQTTTPLTVFEKLVPWKIFLLTLSGFITCIPLILFAYGARRLKLQTLGFIQYLSPSLKFICGIWIFHETLSSTKLHTFYLIWIALGWYTLESFLYMKKLKNRPLPIPE
jgi:chloramphenicol-sensitive protein RarD